MHVLCISIYGWLQEATTQQQSKQKNTEILHFIQEKRNRIRLTENNRMKNYNKMEKKKKKETQRKLLEWNMT